MKRKIEQGQTVYIIGKPGVPFGASVTVLKVIPGTGYACGVGQTTLLVEPEYVTDRIVEIAA